MAQAPEQGTVAGIEAGHPLEIGERYRVEGVLGRGGTAAVYRVLDMRTREHLALKQLLGGNALWQAMFQREYHTLVQLAHPRIVRVFDYGVDPRGPFYTMELLEGIHLRGAFAQKLIAPRELCALARDVASALALIHSRRLLHRDISPRNIWRTPDGRAKLIDFGTLAVMGAQSSIAGTPPYVPPEAVHGQVLDARTDLFGLGALSYFLLTGQHAYPAYKVSELSELWRRPPPTPLELRPDIEPALSELVMALLSLDPRGRPGSAAEVVDRLTAMGQLELDDERPIANAYLTTPTLTGRRAPSLRFRKRLLRATRGRGAALLVTAPAGLGRSRMLASFVLEAKLVGAVALTADGTALEAEPLSAVRVLCEQLFDALPESVALASPHAALLGQLSPRLRTALGAGAGTACEPVAIDARHAQATAAVELFVAASHDRCLLLAVDDVHRIDELSVSVIARLAALAPGRRLLVATSCEATAMAKAGSVLRSLRDSSVLLQLAPFSPEQTEELLRSVFGNAGALDDAVSWLHELSQGNPGTCMEYAQYLVDQGLARYEAGGFRLPPRLRDHSLPQSLDVMLDARVAALGADARTLALALALTYDDTRPAWLAETHVRIEDYTTLLDGAGSTRVWSALDELVRANVLHPRDDHYVYAQRAMIVAVVRASSADERLATHAGLARIFEQGSYPDAGLLYLHLLRSGAHARAVELMVERYELLKRTAYDWSQSRTTLTAVCYQEALEYCEAHAGTPRQKVALRSSLLITATVYDWSLVRHAQAQFAQLERDTGLAYMAETDPGATPLARVQACLARARVIYDATAQERRGLPPEDAIGVLISNAWLSVGAYANSGDAVGVRRVCELVMPLRPLSPVAELFGDVIDELRERTLGRWRRDHLAALAEAFFACTGLADIFRTGGSSRMLHSLGVEDARRGRPSALALADALELRGVRHWSTDHLRWLGHAFAGHGIRAEQFRKRAETLVEDDIWRRNVWLFAEAELHALTGNLQALKQLVPAIAQLARRFPGWRPWHAWAQAELSRLRRDPVAARKHLERALVLAPAGEHRAWVLASPAYAAVLLELGEPIAARDFATRAIAQARALDLDRNAELYTGRVLALCHSRLGEHELATDQINQCFELARVIELAGLPLATLYAAQGEIALAAGNRSRYETALRALARQVRDAEAPVLTAHAQALQEQGRKRFESSTEASGRSERGHAAERSVIEAVHTALDPYPSRRQRAGHALRLLLEDCHANFGLLFLLEEDGPVLAASTSSSRASPALLDFVDEYLSAESAITESVTTFSESMALEQLSQGFWTDDTDNMRYMPVLLWNRDEERSVIAGLALLAAPGPDTHTPQPELAWAISSCLREARDTLTVTVQR